MNIELMSNTKINYNKINKWSFTLIRILENTSVEIKFLYFDTHYLKRKITIALIENISGNIILTHCNNNQKWLLVSNYKEIPIYIRIYYNPCGNTIDYFCDGKLVKLRCKLNILHELAYFSICNVGNVLVQAQ